MLKTNVKRRDLVLLYDVMDGSVNNDPDTNAPRQDPDTGIGSVSAECIKRKIRDEVAREKAGEPGYELLVARGAVLNRAIREAYEEASVKIPDAPKKPAKAAKAGKSGKSASAPKDDEVAEDEEVGQERDQRVSAADAARGNRRLVEKFFDARWFGQVVTGVGAGRITGPVQIQEARSIVPVRIDEVARTRVATTNEEQSKAQKGLNQNRSRKARLSHALYKQMLHISPFQALTTGFSEKDFEVLLKALKSMFENDRSTSRGMVSMRQIVVFEHTDPLGSARAVDLLNSVRVVPQVEAPTCFEQYTVTIDRSTLPAGVIVTTAWPEATASAAAE